MKITAIIVTYNGMQWYDRCFSSLQQSEIPVQIIVIDNASSDGTVNFIKQNYPDIILIESKENLGFAKANNLGMRYALDHGADYVFLLNQDAWLNQTNTISVLIEQSRLNPDFAILSPLQLYGSGERIAQDTQAHYLYKSELNNHDFVSDLYFNRLKDVYETPYVCAASWLIPIEVVKSIGGFDPLFFHYGEDDNYIQRIHYWGWKVGICPRVNICHDYEDRPASYTAENLDWKKYILIELGDVNNDIDMNSINKAKLALIIKNIFKLNPTGVNKLCLEYLYLKNIMSRLINSRTQNKQKYANWL